MSRGLWTDEQKEARRKLMFAEQNRRRRLAEPKPWEQLDELVYGPCVAVTGREAIAWALRNCPLALPDRGRLPWINWHRQKQGLPAFSIKRE